MRIGELARQSGASIRSLRHYDAMGLLAAQRQPNGYRHFDHDAVHRVQHIQALLALGFTVADIRLLLPCLTDEARETQLCPFAMQTYRQQLATLDARIQTLQAIRDRVAARLPGDKLSSYQEFRHDP